MSTEEITQLKAIWEAASDYLMGLKRPGFAMANGGIDKLKTDLTEAVRRYEE